MSNRPSTFSGYGAALPWDENLEKKPAYDAILSALQGAAGTNSSSTSTPAVETTAPAATTPTPAATKTSSSAVVATSATSVEVAETPVKTPAQTPAETAAETPSSTPAASGSASGSAVARYGQCGGVNYSGSTACESGATCKEWNKYYFQCI